MSGNRVTGFVAGAAAGALAMYLVDPDRGRARRARARDRLMHEQQLVRDQLGRAVRDLEHRASGIGAELGASLWGEPKLSDEKLVARVRAQLGRLCTHPHAVSVEAHDGAVTLRGPVLAGEVAQLVRRVRATRGVRELLNQLEVHTEPDVAALRSGPTTPRPTATVSMRLGRTPAGRLVTALAGAGLGARALKRGGLLGTGLSLVAFGAAGRALSQLTHARFE